MKVCNNFETGKPGNKKLKTGKTGFRKTGKTGKTGKLETGKLEYGYLTCDGIFSM